MFRFRCRLCFLAWEEEDHLDGRDTKISATVSTLSSPSSIAISSHPLCHASKVITISPDSVSITSRRGLTLRISFSDTGCLLIKVKQVLHVRKNRGEGERSINIYKVPCRRKQRSILRKKRAKTPTKALDKNQKNIYN